MFFDKQHRFFFFLCGKGKGALETKTRELSRRAADKREKSKKKREKRRGRALSKTFPSLSPVLLPHIIAVSFCLYLEREKNDREDARIAEKKKRERDFLLSPVSSREGCRHSQNDEQKKKEEESIIIFFFGLGKLNWSIRNLQTLK